MRRAADRSGYRDRGRLCGVWLCSRCTFLLGNGNGGNGHRSSDPLTHHRRDPFLRAEPLFWQTADVMHEWIDYYDSTHTIYASKLHRDLHFQLIASDIIGYISSPDAVVLDYACGEALSAAKVAEACDTLYLAEPAPGVRGRLIARFAPNTRIRVRSLDDLRQMREKSIDLAVMNSVAQYMSPEELDSAFATIRRLLKPGGRLVLGDILRPEIGMLRDVFALLRFAARNGFLRDA